MSDYRYYRDGEVLCRIDLSRGRVTTAPNGPKQTTFYMHPGVWCEKGKQWFGEIDSRSLLVMPKVRNLRWKVRRAQPQASRSTERKA